MGIAEAGQNGWVLDGSRDDRMSGLVDASGRTMEEEEAVSSQTQTGYGRILKNYQQLRCDRGTVVCILQRSYLLEIHTGIFIHEMI